MPELEELKKKYKKLKYKYDYIKSECNRMERCFETDSDNEDMFHDYNDNHIYFDEKGHCSEKDEDCGYCSVCNKYLCKCKC